MYKQFPVEVFGIFSLIIERVINNLFQNILIYNTLVHVEDDATEKRLLFSFDDLLLSNLYQWRKRAPFPLLVHETLVLAAGEGKTEEKNKRA